jgi:hypothetical protein
VPSDKTIERDLSLRNFRVKQVIACTYTGLAIRLKRDRTIQIFSASLTDIERALRPEPKLSLEEIIERLLEYYRRFAQVFNPEEAAKLPRYRPGFDHEIILEKNTDGKDKEVP